MQEPTRLDNPAAIAQLLGRVLDSRAALAVNLGLASAVSSSLLLELDYAGHSLLLDECIPHQSRDLVQPGTKLRVRARIDGGHIEFKSTVLEVITHHGAAAYRIGLPELVLHHERRDSYRLSISQELPYSSLISGADGQARRVRLVDISRHGAGTVVLSQIKAAIGSSLDCVLELPDLRLDTGVQVRSVGNSAGQQRLGLMFDKLDPAKRQTVDRAVSAIERSLLRQHLNARWM